jgi:hypothetical protein
MTTMQTDDNPFREPEPESLFARAGVQLRAPDRETAVLDAEHARRLRVSLHAAQIRHTQWKRRRRTGLGTFAGAAVAATVLMLAGVFPGVRSPGGASQPSGDEITFALPAAAARHVALVGEFNEWNPASTPMTKDNEGRWAVRLRMPPGRHTYAFVVDDTTWVADPHAARAPERWFGDPRSVLVVAGAQ